MLKTQEEAKRVAGEKAVEFIKDGMLVGLGSGTTSHYFIKALIKRFKKGLKIKTVATSIESQKLAQDGNLPMLDINTLTSIDLTVDGADEVDPHKQLIKGWHGFLLREKICATMSKEMMVIVDQSKLVDKLGKMPLPVEITPFANKATIKHINDAGYQGKLRMIEEDKPFLTDNKNYIYDLHFSEQRSNPREDQQKLINIPGVIETGFFFDLANKVIVGYENGNVEVL